MGKGQVQHDRWRVFQSRRDIELAQQILARIRRPLGWNPVGFRQAGHVQGATAGNDAVIQGDQVVAGFDAMASEYRLDRIYMLSDELVGINAQPVGAKPIATAEETRVVVTQVGAHDTHGLTCPLIRPS
ncbi:MAG: hypothetical protein BWZ07_03074 [Alphaproteobacteria bacterium ADurb.BinA280]|nr:MAG: hypothetical protein BWZ07_03074 [Alphaproteobacteria bacterium ADurb.BinA280]